MLFSTWIEGNVRLWREIPKEFKLGKYYVIVIYLDYRFISNPLGENLNDTESIVAYEPSAEMINGNIKEILEFATEKEALNYIKNGGVNND